MKDLGNLSEAQKAKIPAYKDKWHKISVCTDRVDFEEAKKWAIECYRVAGLTPPTEFHFAASPIAAARLAAELKSKGKKASASDLQQNIHEMIYGFQDASWLAFFDFIGAELGEDITRAAPLIELAKVCGWWAPYDTCAILQDRPTILNLDDEGRFHGEYGPAVTYTDGVAMYAWHGVQVPDTWIKDRSSITPAEALMWRDMEQRRAACEILGWANILRTLNAKTIHKDPDPQIGELLEVDLPGAGKQRFLRVLCGTGREFALPVPRQYNTALEANAATYNVKPEDLQRIEVRT